MAGPDAVNLTIRGVTVPFPASTADRSSPTPLNSEALDMISQYLWKHFKEYMIDENGRPYCDEDQTDIDGDKDVKERVTVSEGVAYVLLRAVWMNDEAQFFKTWNWASKNMQRNNLGQVYSWNNRSWQTPRKNDHLFAWRYLPNFAEREGGVIDYSGNGLWRGGLEGASDADLDIAAALVMAFLKWGKPEYKTDALALLTDIKKYYVGKRGGKYYMFGGDQFTAQGELNPSYLRPYYFRNLFPQIDTSFPWPELATTSYDVIERSSDMDLNNHRGTAIPGSVNLPSNWVQITQSGAITDSSGFAAQGRDLFGQDAFRVLPSIAMAWAFGQQPEALRYLTDNTGTVTDVGPYSFLRRELMERGKILAGYMHDGSEVPATAPASYGLQYDDYRTTSGAYLPFFYYAGDVEATQILLNQALSYYNTAGFFGGTMREYYKNSWAAIGLLMINRNPLDTSYTYPEVELLPPGEGDMSGLATLFAQVSRPPVFTKNSDYALNIFLKNRDDIALQKARIARDTKTYGKVDTSWYFDPSGQDKAAKARLGIFEAYCIEWLLTREIGSPNDQLLIDAMNLGRTMPLKTTMPDKNPSWENKIAFILASEPVKNKELLLAFFRLNVTYDDPNNLRPCKKQLFIALLEYYNDPHRKEGRDPMMAADILFQISVNTEDKPERLDRLAEAEIEINYVLDPKYEAKMRKIIRNRVQFRSTEDGSSTEIDNIVNKEYKLYQGRARSLRAQILIFHSDNITDITQKQSWLEEAYQLTLEAAPLLDGLDFLQLEQVAAKAQLRLGYLKRDQDAEYLEYFSKATGLLLHILSWRDDYNAQIVNFSNNPDPAVRSLWLDQIAQEAQVMLSETLALDDLKVKGGE